MPNVTIAKADIVRLDYPDESFDKVVAANVIHLLDSPGQALVELMRVCRTGGEVIVPTYLVGQRRSMARAVVNVVNMFSPTFRLQFDADSYRQFFEGMGYDASFELVDGRLPCAIALLKK